MAQVRSILMNMTPKGRLMLAGSVLGTIVIAFLLMRMASAASSMVRPPKKRINRADNQSMGETRPSFTREMITAMTIAAMKAAVPNIMAVIGLPALILHLLFVVTAITLVLAVKGGSSAPSLDGNNGG